MLVSDKSFLMLRKSGAINVEPFEESRLQPASIDLTLGDDLLLEDGTPRSISDDPLGEYTLWPGEFLLATTHESVKVGPLFAGRVEGKSSLGRRGIFVHVTAGFIDPGFEGKITLELYNASHRVYVLRAGQPICQITFLHMDGRPDRVYGDKRLGSKYQNQTTVTGARDATE